jgi:hypothetical protein
MTLLVLVFALASAIIPSACLADALDEALALEGLARSDLGWRPRGYWSRFPADIPHKLRHFDELLSQPLATITFTRTAAAAARALLSSEALAKIPEKSDGSLYQAVQLLGVDRKFGAFRAYSANLEAEPTDIVDALLLLKERSGRKTTFVTFGNPSPYPNDREDLKRLAEVLPEGARQPLGKLVLNLLDAHGWIELAFRNVPVSARLAVQRRLDLGVELTDALEYFPELDDAAATLDEASLWYGGLKAVAALELCRHELEGVGSAPPFRFDWLSPLGWVRLNGIGPGEIDGQDSFLVVDLGGNDRYAGGVAAPSSGRLLSVLLEMGGDDGYEGSESPTQGAGLAGVGVLLDVRGRDRYAALQCAQGFGQLGLGVLADLSGDDEYVSRFSSQGAAFLGVGVLLEGDGFDSYRVESDGQGFGGAGGVGTLADRSGSDRYEAVRDPAVTGRPSYHSELRIAVSNAQGVGSGRRGDGADGHSWAGGLGQLLDVEGDDEYIAGNWSMGTGYWFGTGLLHDGAGDDLYHGVVWSQGSGAHFCVGALVDEAGDDRHLVEEKGSASLAFGHDFTVALLVDAAGNDSYEIAEGDGLGFAINRSVAALIDAGGDDLYRGKPGNRPAAARFAETFANHDTTHTYFAEASSLALFLDAGGSDTYEVDSAANDSTWLDPEDSPNRDVRNFSIGVDRAASLVDLRAEPERPPSKPAERRVSLE